MKTFFFLTLFAVSYICSIAQVITIQDQLTKKPLEHVTLFSANPTVFQTTNSQGQVDLSSFDGSEQVEIRLLGYKTEVKSYSEIKMGAVLFLFPSTFNMDEVVISASRFSQLSKDVPSKITTISAKEVSLQNPQTAADLLGISGSVFIQKSQQGGGSPMIRGFATNRLIYTIDGVRMNTAIFRGGNLQNVISLDPFATERTEVLFGPGSVIYGSDAIGGVMSFSTLTPQLSYTDKPFITGKANMRYATANNEKTAHFDVNVGWKKWALLTSISSNDYGDLVMGSNGPNEYLRPFYIERQDSMDVIIANGNPKKQVPSGYTQMNLMQKVRFKPNDKWNVQYGFHYSETSNYSRYDRHVRYKNGLPRYGEWYYGPQKWMMNNLIIESSGKTSLYDQLSVRLAHQFFEESRVSRDLNANNREIRIEEVTAYSVNVDLTKTIGKNKLFYGVEAVQNDVRSSGINENIGTGLSVPGAARYPQATWESYGVYVTDQFKVSDLLMLQAGARYNQFGIDAVFDTSFYAFPFTEANINNGALTGSVGFVYRPGAKFVISGNAATAFRSPNVDDVGKVFDSEPGSVVIPNPSLEAEYAYNADLGIAKLFGNVLKLDITGYYTLLENALVRRDFTLNGQDSIIYDGTLSQVQAIQNAAVARVYGVQGEIKVKLPQDFSFSTRLNYQLGEEELDDGTISPSRHAAPWFGKTALTYRSNALYMEFYTQYSGEKSFDDLPESEKSKDYIYAIDANGNPYSPAWYTLNFKALYDLNDYFAISAGIENITDQRYRPYSSGIVAPGRNFILSLKAQF